MIPNRPVLAIILSLFFYTSAWAQNKEKQPLRTVLKALEQRYNITFTYLDENIRGIYLPAPPKKNNLAETMAFLGQQTGLLFQQLNERYVTISKRSLAQQPAHVCGFIVDSESGKPVEGASIQSGDEYTISDEGGYFEIKKVKPDSMVHIRFVGYKPLDTARAASCMHIVLHPHFTTLETVFVTDFITEGIDKITDGSLVVRTENLGALPGLTEPDVLQTIQTLPGVQSVQEKISDINVRGGTSDQNLVLWDGIRMYHSGHFFGLISAYSPYLTKKVTITKNGTSAGSGDGVSSTFDIRSDDNLTESLKGGAGVNMLNADIFAKIPLSKKISMHLAARRSIADLVETPTYRQYFRRAFNDTELSNGERDSLVSGTKTFHFYDVSLKLLYDLSGKDKLRFSLLQVSNDIAYKENAFVDTVLTSRTSQLGQKNLATGIAYSRLWSEQVRMSAQLYLSAYTLGAVNFDIPNDQRLIQENNVLDTGLKLETRINLSDKMDLLTGYQFFEVGVTNLEDINHPRFNRSVKRVVRSHGSFAESSFSSGKTNIRLGARGTYFPGFARFIAEPRLSFNQRFLEYFSFEILAEMKNQTISQVIDLQTDFLGVEKRRWILSDDEDIPVLRSRQLSAGIYYKRNNFLFTAEGYYKFITGIITSSQGFQDQFQFVRSIGDYNSHGIDVLLNKSFSGFTAWLSYSNAKSTFKFSQLVPPSFPNNLDVRHRLSFGCNYVIENFELSGGFNWHTGKPFSAPIPGNEIVARQVNYGLPNNSRLGSYLRADISLGYKFLIWNAMRAHIGASVWNVFNNQNIVNTYFRASENDQLESIRQYSLGITPNVNVRIHF